jgi:two-component system, OmpR family, sensor histidine kinase MtrB
VRTAARTVVASYRSWVAGPQAAVLAEGRRRIRLIRNRYRRSLQFRVTTTTLVMSTVVVSVLGYLLMQHLDADIYGNKQQNALQIVDVGLGTAGSKPKFAKPPSPASGGEMWALADQLRSTGGTPYAVDVTLLPAFQGPEDQVYSGGAAIGFYLVDTPQPKLPVQLTKAVRRDLVRKQTQGGPTQVSREWTSMAVGSSSRPVPGLLVGAPFGSEYELYYFFPLAAEQLTVASIQQNLLLAGIAVVFLLAAVAWLVTRWVVVPVRLAAQGARRLSTGQLNERMEVRGSDELAVLATSFNEMAASLQEKLAELEDLSQVQRQFVSDVSHELRTPLTTIRIASDVLFAAKDEMAPAATRSAELLQSQIDRFESLLTDLLEISRYDANAATLDAEAVDVCTIVLQSADVAQQLAERRGTKIEFRLPAEPCIAEVDRRRVERILRNLLLNAVEHGENKDTVVTVAMDSAAVAITVRDFGVGLHPGEEQLVFDRFWRADPARARTSGGTGLGLAIALEDARLHGGWLDAWGEPGHGSVFRLTLPRVAGGQLHGSPLPLSPRQVGLEAADLVDVGADLVAAAVPMTDPAGLAAWAESAESAESAEPVAAAGADQAGPEVPSSADAASEPAASELSASEPAASEPAASEGTASEDTASEDTAASEVGARG